MTYVHTNLFQMHCTCDPLPSKYRDSTSNRMIFHEVRVLLNIYY